MSEVVPSMNGDGSPETVYPEGIMVELIRNEFIIDEYDSSDNTYYLKTLYGSDVASAYGLREPFGFPADRRRGDFGFHFRCYL